MFSLSKSECLTKPIQLQLLQNQEIFAEFLSAFPAVTSNLKYLEKEDEPQSLFVSEIIDCKKQSYLNV